MGVLNDKMIRQLAHSHDMINPFVEKQNADGVISYGLSSYGYDVRVGNRFKIFHNLKSEIIDPKTTKQDYFIDHEGDDCVIPPNSYVLAHTVEKFLIPRHVLAMCMGKSTYARWGIIVNVTPLEPEWEGTVTLEISNATPSPVRIHANEGICQIAFFTAVMDPGYQFMECETSYADRKGKYQGQEGITLGKVLP